MLLRADDILWGASVRAHASRGGGDDPKSPPQKRREGRAVLIGGRGASVALQAQDVGRVRVKNGAQVGKRFERGHRIPAQVVRHGDWVIPSRAASSVCVMVLWRSVSQSRAPICSDVIMFLPSR